MHRHYLPTSSAVSALAIGGSLAGMLALSNMGMGAQGQSDLFLDASGDGGAGGGTGGENNGGGQSNQGGNQNAPDAAELQRKLDAANAQIGTLTTERDTFKGKAEKYEGDSQTEAEKQAGKLTKAEQDRDAALKAVKDTNVTLAIEREARKLNIVDEDAAARLIDMSAVQFGTDNKPTNIPVLLADLIKAKPYLVKSEETTTGGGSSNPQRGRSGDNGKPKTRAEAITSHYSQKK